MEFYFRFRSRSFHLIRVSFCIRLPTFIQIGTSAAEIWRRIDFQDDGLQPCCVCFGVMGTTQEVPFVVWIPTSNCYFVGLIVPEILRCKKFWLFGLKLPIHAPFWEFLGEYFPHMTSPIVLTPKKTVLGRKHVIWAIQRNDQNIFVCDFTSYELSRVKNPTTG